MFSLFKRREKAPPPLDWQELYLQCLANVRYLRAHVNVLNANIEHLKTLSTRANRAKLARLEETRNWMLRKLKEEEADLEYFKKKLAPIFKNPV